MSTVVAQANPPLAVVPGTDGIEAPTVSTSTPKSAVANAGWNAFFTVWSSGISLILTPWLVGHLGVEYYGILLLIWSLTGVLGIMNLGLGEATLRYVALYAARNDLAAINRVVGSTLALYLGASLVMSAVLVGAAPDIASALGVPEADRALVLTLIRLTALIVTLGILGRTVGAIPAALQRYDLSTKVNLVHSVVRFGGYAVLLWFGLGILQLVLWDAVTLFCMFIGQVLVAKRLLPGVILWPRLSRNTGRELLSYSIFSFLTHVFHTMHREAAKLLTGGYLGPNGVSYVGVPDNLSQRVHGLVASAGETLLPRFSATANAGDAASLFWSSTWVATFVTVMIFVPYSVFLPDFLRLWIGPEFAQQSMLAAQLVALSYVAQSVFVPAATLARGSGRPGIVTVVILFCGMTMLLVGISLIPRLGLAGVGIAYVTASIPAAAGTVYVARSFFKTPVSGSFVRAAVIPLTAGAAAYAVTSMLRSWSSTPGWAALLFWGVLAAAFTAVVVLGAEEIIAGRESTTRVIVAHVARRLRLHRLLPKGSSS